MIEKRAGHGEKFSRKAESFLAALLVERTVTLAAKSAGISEATAGRWQQNAQFKKRYMEARREAVQQTAGRLQAACGVAVDVLLEVALKSASDAARVSAAKSILESAVKTLELDHALERIDRLEKQMNERNKK